MNGTKGKCQMKGSQNEIKRKAKKTGKHIDKNVQKESIQSNHVTENVK